MANKENVESIDYNVKEILDNIEGSKKLILTPEDKKNIKDSLDFEGAIENIDIGGNDNRVIYTDGDEQLLYEDGEFFLVSSTDSLKSRVKKKREEARNMYIEYFIKHMLNPLLKQKQINNIAKTISVEEPKKQKNSRDSRDSRDSLKSKVKSVPDKESQNSISRKKEGKVKDERLR